ncbi:hypothetical protein KOAAANKH_00078 [Brevundimonas sp. NIBR10]|uniref:hypothetical protein n=1 Tax=Brevundimonas sp. NIBR10 TaxID=3015997 RepID=UPI0022F1B06A|nr:hypothetical protein [Brevundimonas sp. NIBR10]WGM45217.1 hypothetical protein KOAAANKH_00078 [Brevundimonas sp. NIBR10]
MGRKNLDRYSIADWRAACPTVASIRRARWTVTAVCAVCDLEIIANLDAIIAAKGSDYRLWGASAACRRRWCEGKAAFFVKPPGATVEFRMTDEREPS